MNKISMSRNKVPTIQQAFDLFIRKCKVKNLTELSIESYKKKIIHFYKFMDGETSLATITSDTIDDYILWLRDNIQANDIMINAYLSNLRLQKWESVICMKYS